MYPSTGKCLVKEARQKEYILYGSIVKESRSVVSGCGGRREWEERTGKQQGGITKEHKETLGG